MVVHLKNGSRTFVYKNSTNILAKGRALSFETGTICRGNYINNDGSRCQRQFDERTYSGLENCIQNPVLATYRRVDGKYEVTLVTVYLDTPGIDGYELIED